MSELFLKVFELSVIASYAAAAIILVRLLLKKAPKVFSYAIWAIVLFRLVCPFTFESPLSLIPNNYEVTIPDITSEQPAVNVGIDKIEKQQEIPVTEPSVPVNTEKNVSPTINLKEVLSYIWLSGSTVLILYGIISYFKLKHQLSDATLKTFNIYETDRIKIPFVMGIIKPKIYLPIGLSEKESDYIIKHENTHIKRFDYLIKLMAFLALCLHWFNPVIWLSYFLMIKDMEMSCDESVIKHSNEDIRTNYSSSLLSLSIKQSNILIPLAFGESNVKSRIKNILNFKKPAFWVSAVVLAALILVALSLVSNSSRLEIPNIYISSENSGEQAEAIIGTYGWDFGNEQVESDSISPYEFTYTSKNTVNLPVITTDNKIVISNQKFNSDKKVPFTVENIVYWDKSSKETILNSDSYSVNNGSIYITVPEDAGSYIYSLHLEYERGDVFYGFKVNVVSPAPMKGLELYVWKNKELTGNDDTYFTLLYGTNRNKVESEIYDLNIAVNSIEELNELLELYDSETFLFIYQMNTTDFTKPEMDEIADKIDFPKENGVRAIGLWQSSIQPEDIIDAPVKENFEHEFAIYLVKNSDKKTAIEQEKDKVELEETPIFTDEDMIYYNKEDHSFELNEAAEKKLRQDLHVPVSGTPFVLTVYGERIYLGAFWTAISSVSTSLPTIDIILKPFSINMGYPGNLEGTEDVRNDDRIFNALNDAGKLKTTNITEE